MFFCSCLHSKQVYTSPLAKVHRSSLENSVRPVKLGVSFSDASSWEHQKAPDSKGHKPGQLHAQSSLPWCWTALFPGIAKKFAQLLRAKSYPWERIIGLRQDVLKHSSSSPEGRTEEWCQGELRGVMGIPEKLGPGGSEKVGVGKEGQGEKAC